MADTILNTVKTMLELDISDNIYDDELLLYLNSGIQYLINNKIPITLIDKTTTIDAFTNLKSGDSQLLTEWLHFYCMPRFDMELSSTTLNWINSELENLIYHLKTVYDTFEVGVAP